MTMGESIKYYRLKAGLTQDELGEKLGLQKSAIAKYENGRVENIKRSVIQKMAEVLNCNASELLGLKQVNNSSVRIPVLGRVAAGIPISAVTDIIDWEEITPEMAADGEYFGLQIKGNSMEPRICNGDVVICRQQEDANDGDTVIALINGEDATCKKLKKYPDGTICLIPTNPAYQPLIFTVDEINRKPVRVIGVVKELRGKF